jgi:hypothetical protein
MFGTLKIDEIWEKCFWLHLDDKTSHEKNLEFYLHEFLNSFQEFDSNSFEF